MGGHAAGAVLRRTQCTLTLEGETGVLWRAHTDRSLLDAWQSCGVSGCGNPEDVVGLLGIKDEREVGSIGIKFDGVYPGWAARESLIKEINERLHDATEKIVVPRKTCQNITPPALWAFCKIENIDGYLAPAYMRVSIFKGNVLHPFLHYAVRKKQMMLTKWHALSMRPSMQG